MKHDAEHSVVERPCPHDRRPVGGEDAAATTARFFGPGLRNCSMTAGADSDEVTNSRSP